MHRLELVVSKFLDLIVRNIKPENFVGYWIVATWAILLEANDTILSVRTITAPVIGLLVVVALFIFVFFLILLLSYSNDALQSEEIE